jgi:hypothetical protein
MGSGRSHRNRICGNDGVAIFFVVIKKKMKSPELAEGSPVVAI